MSIEQRLRTMQGVSKMTLVRNTARGEWQAAVCRQPNGTTFSLGIDDDPIIAIGKALDAFEGAVAPVSGAVAAPQPMPSGSPATTEPAYRGGIFG